MTPRLWLGAGIVLLALIYETWGVLDPQPGDTFSELTRAIFGVSTTVGYWIFIVFWGVFAAWFGVHIIGGRKPAPKHLTAVPPPDPKEK